MSSPNILVVGTPGVGKTSFCRELASRVDNLQHLDCSKIVSEEQLFEDFDKERDCSVFDEDRLFEYIEDRMLEAEEDGGSVAANGGQQDVDMGGTATGGGLIIDFHSSGFMGGLGFALIVVLRADIEEIGKRLEKRGYSPQKIQENVQCEIFQECLDEVRDTFEEELGRSGVSSRRAIVPSRRN